MITLFDALTQVSLSLLATLKRQAPPINNFEETGIKVIIEVKDPYTKAMLTGHIVESLERYVPIEPDTATSKLIRDNFVCMGVEIEFREAGVPTQFEEIRGG